MKPHWLATLTTIITLFLNSDKFNLLPSRSLKEKLYAAVRAGIKTVIIPEENKKDLEEISQKIIKNLNIVTIVEAKSVLDHSLTKSLPSQDFAESNDIKEVKSDISQENITESTTH